MSELNLCEYGPIQLSIRVSNESCQDGGYAPWLHIRAYHTNRKKVVITSFKDEKVEMEVPQKFYKADMKAYISICGEDILKDLKNALDSEWGTPPVPLTYDSLIPFRGNYVPICILSDNSSDKNYFSDDVLYLKSGLQNDEIRNVVLDLFGEMAYDVFKKRLDYFAKIMKVQYEKLEIDDGRRTWGSYNEETEVIFMSRRMIMMNDSAIDSLIVHELAHTKFFNHNENFHNELLKVMPNYDEVDKAFLDTAQKLFEEGWI